MSLQLILISLPFYPLVLLRFATSPSPMHMMYPFARFPFARFLEDIVQVESPMIWIHTCEFTHTHPCVINQSIQIRMWSINHTISSYDLLSPHVRSHPLRFLAYLLNLYVDTWSCLHVCPSLAYYGESYFAQQNPRKSSSTAFRFLQRLSDFFNGFPLSETAFRFLQRLSDFLQRLSTFWEIQENLSMGANIQKIAIRASYFPLKIAIFRDKIIGGWNTNNRRLEYKRSLFWASYFPLRAP